MGSFILVLGGASSGKSALAERFAATLDEELHRGVSYIAAGLPQGSTDVDEDWITRVKMHQERRPSSWRTIELADPFSLYDILLTTEQIVMVDSVGSWLARLDSMDGVSKRLSAALRGRRSPAVVVSEEVGMSIHPMTTAGRQFQKTLGELNQLLADMATRIFLVVAGRAIDLSASASFASNSLLQPYLAEQDRPSRN